MTAMRFAWVGSHAEGVPAFIALMDAGAPIRGVVTLTPERRAQRSAAVDYRPLCERYGLPLYEVADINGDDGLAALHALDPDVVFVIGWSQIVRARALHTARVGMIGTHASLLPRNRGSAPVNWALIRGEQDTGNSLIWLSEELDAGDLIDQTAFGITPYDSCATLYDRVAESNRDMLLRTLPQLLQGQRPGQPQAVVADPVLPRRRSADGMIDWRAPSRAVYDLIRAVTRPYPGAFSRLDGTRWAVWNAVWPALPDRPLAAPGEVLGPAYSPVDAACGQVVACGSGAVVLLDLEAEDGQGLAGRALAERPWAGRRWGDD